jgi:HSP20 family protein
MESLLSQLFGENGISWASQAYAPPIDLREDDEAVEVRMDLPGMPPDEIDIQVTGRQLTVTGVRPEEAMQRGERLHRAERPVGRFARVLGLPCEIQEEAIEATSRAGVLTIRMPKSERARTRHIRVKAK